MRKKIAYIVSGGKGLESFIYSEIKECLDRGEHIELYFTKFTRNDHFSPSSSWIYFTLNIKNILLGGLFMIFQKPLKVGALLKAVVNNDLYRELPFVLAYSRLISKRKIDQIHCHFGDRKYFIGSLIKEILDLELSVTIHAHELYANPNRDYFKESIVKADKIIAISELNRQILVDEFNVEADKTRIIRLGIDLSRFYPRAHVVRILIVARYTERKGFRELMDALAGMPIENWELITVGFGDLNIKDLACHAGIEDKVTVFGKMDAKQLSYFYNSADIFCLPSKHTEVEGSEGIPVVLMEAMACGLHVITTNNGSIPELVDDTVVQQGNVEDLREALIQVIGKTDVQDKFYVTKNIEKVADFYSKENVGRLIEYFYE